MIVEFTAIGIAMPKGSKTAFVRGGRAVLTDARTGEARARYVAWKESVAEAARAWVRANGSPPAIETPVRVLLAFHLPRPASTPKRVTHHAKKPDLDKLCRNVCDVLSGIIYTDDARMVELHATKGFAIDRVPGVDVRVVAV